IHGKRRSNHHQARQQTFTFANAAGARVELIVQVANDGVAFRYRFPGTDKQPRKLVDELTGFSVPAGATAWLQEQQPPTRYSPAYEALFTEVAAGTAAPTPSGWAFPALFRIENGSTAQGSDWLLITEADVS